jgi:hypothetical protein
LASKKRPKVDLIANAKIVAIGITEMSGTQKIKLNKSNQVKNGKKTIKIRC